MTLSERLERARRERLRAKGKLSDDDVEARESLAPPRDDAPGEPRLFEPVTIEALPRSGPHPVVGALAGGPTGNGPTESVDCPNCGAPGRVDLVDLVGHRSHYSCDACHAMWQVTSSATVE